MKLPIPQEILDQLGSTDRRMGEIVDALNKLSEQLAELIELEKTRASTCSTLRL